MASIISAGTTSGTALNMSGDTSGALQLATNGTTTAITVDASQNVGIGTASPSSFGKFAVTAASGTIGNLESTQAATNANLLNLNATQANSSSGVRFQINSGTTAQARIQLNGGNEILFQNTSSDTERMRIDGSGSLLINGTTQPVNTYKQVIAFSGGSGGVGGGLLFNDSDSGNTYPAVYFRKDGAQRGNINVATSGTTYNTVSDYRLKENIAPMTGALAKVTQLKPVTYKWKSDGEEGQGFIAHELQAIVPDCVTGAKDAVDADGKPVYQGIDTSFLVATLTAAIQELKAINDTQAETINALTARIVALETV